jgi:hypothetical protein
MLPRQLQESFVLVHRSRGLGKASKALPRPIQFSWDAKFMMAYSGHTLALDPTAQSFEIIEYNDTTRAWQVGVIDFSTTGSAAPTYSKDASRCVSCHGPSLRPIWGEYPNWPDSYGGSLGHSGVDAMSATELAEFQAWAQKAPASPDYKNLKFIKTSSGYRMANDRYGLPNTVFTARLANRFAESAYQRIARSADYVRLRYAMLLASPSMECAIPTDVSDKVRARYSMMLSQNVAFNAAYGGQAIPGTLAQTYRLTGIDPIKDLRLDLLVNAVPPAVDGTAWNAGGDSMGRLVEFLVFRQVLQQDSSLRTQFASRLTKIETIYTNSFQTDAIGLQAINDYGTYGSLDVLFPFLHFNVYYPILKASYTYYKLEQGENRGAAVCGLLTNSARAALAAP